VRLLLGLGPVESLTMGGWLGRRCAGLWAAVLGLVVVAGGCGLAEQGRKIEQLQQQNNQLSQEVSAARQQVVAQQQLLEAQSKRIATLLALGTKRLEDLYYPVRLEIERLSGGYDEDGKPGDDGVVVYIRPIDSDGDAIKAAGSISVELFDLANPDGEHMVGQMALSLEQARKVWYGRLWTQHYTVKCPWLNARPPEHSEVTIRVTFTDYLSGQTLYAQHVCTVKRPPEPLD
jgi:hypothetical protein